MFFLECVCTVVEPPLMPIRLSNLANSLSHPRFVKGAYFSFSSSIAFASSFPSEKNYICANCRWMVSITSSSTAAYRFSLPLVAEAYESRVFSSSGILFLKNCRTPFQFLAVLTTSLLSIPIRSISGKITMSPSLSYTWEQHRNQSFCMYVETASTNLFEFMSTTAAKKSRIDWHRAKYSLQFQLFAQNDLL